MKQPVILYGAGQRGRLALEEAKKNNLNVVGFCDGSLSKIGTIYCDLPVFSKQDVFNRYGNDFVIFITPNSPTKEEIQIELLEEGFVKEHQILNFVPKEKMQKKYISCPDLRSVAVVAQDALYCCCCLPGDLSNQSPYVTLRNDSIKENVRDFAVRRNALMKELKEGHSTCCDGCPKLQEGYWGDTTEKIKVLALSPSYPCQLSCIYCDVVSNARFMQEHKDVVERAKALDVISVIQAMEEEDILDLQEPIQVSGGEITLYPKHKELLSFLSKYPLQIFSNAVIYDDQIAQLIAREGSFLNVSIDAGTPETYHKIKGMDVFETVLQNITKYKKQGGHIEIKYILMSENCNQKDIDGFLEFCIQTKVDRVNISCDISIDHSNLPQNILEAAIYMGQRVIQSGISYAVLPYFGKANCDYIMEKLNKSNVI